MSWRRGAAAAACITVLATPAVAGAADPPPGAAMSSNLEYVHRSADAAGITEGKFDRIGKTDVLVVTGRFGFKTYDVTDPADPKLLDTFMPEGIATRLDAQGRQGYWQDEDMELDTKRNLIIGALDPRHNDQDPAATGCPDPDGDAVRDPDCKSGFYVISYGDPANLRQIGDFVSLPAGHTSSCIQDCKYIWTGGPARRDDQGNLGPYTRTGNFGLPPVDSNQPPSMGNRTIGDGRPIWVTDLRNPAKPQVSDEPIDLWRNDGYTDYSHDVDEDENGIAWVAGRGGIRGYATEGRHRDPFQNRVREATPFDPILVAGGGVAWDDPNVQGDDGTAQPTMFMHNSGRPTDGSVKADGVRKGNVLVGTEEDFTTTNGCGDSGRIVFSDITDSLGRRAGLAVDPREPVSDEDARLVPSVPGHARDRGPRSLGLLGALLRDRGPDAGRRLVRPGPATARHLQRAQRQPGGLLPRRRERRPGHHGLELVGRRLPLGQDEGQARQDDDGLRLPVRHEPRRRGARDQGRPGQDQPHEGGHGAEHARASGA